jgi:excisionase family DNA binding protein
MTIAPLRPPILNQAWTATQKLWTTKQLAAALNVAPRTVRLWAECDEIPAIRVGKQWRFPVSRMEVWMTERVNAEWAQMVCEEPGN